MPGSGADSPYQVLVIDSGVVWLVDWSCEEQTVEVGLFVAGKLLAAGVRYAEVDQLLAAPARWACEGA
jgi:hypothetical protein